MKTFSVWRNRLPVGWVKSHRFWMFGAVALLMLAAEALLEGDGAKTLVWLHRQYRPAVSLVFVYFASKALMPGDAREAFRMAMLGNAGAGLAAVARALVIVGAMVMVSWSNSAFAKEPPVPIGQEADLPMLVKETRDRWNARPPVNAVAVNASLVRQESGWKKTAALHTSREDGAGYGQFTRAYRADGSIRFDAVEDIAKVDASLKGWSWADRYNATMQLRAVAVKNRECFRRQRKTAVDDLNAFSLCDAEYNSGPGNVIAAQKVCRLTAGCHPGIWEGHVNQHLVISNLRPPGYGQSLRDINLTHVHNVINIYLPKYQRVLGDKA